MRVLWFSVTPALYEKRLSGTWIGALQKIIQKESNIDLGVAFEHTDNVFKVVNDDVTYYPINIFKDRWTKLRVKMDDSKYWQYLEPCLLRVVNDFKPDVIHCFGSEWPYSLIADKISVPIVIHIQGFINLYSEASRQAIRVSDLYHYYKYNPIKIFRYKYRENKRGSRDERERIIMRKNSFFMGRTEWDRNIVKYYSPGSTYFYCPEAIREEIYNATTRWRYFKRDKMRLITISSASGLKGNGLILKTAKILKDFGFQFEWRVAGSKNVFEMFEDVYKLKHEDLNITLLGFIDNNKIVEELSNADAYVHTAIIDNSPNSLCEAQLIGCPVVTTFVGGIPSLVENEKTGIFYPYNEPHTLAMKLMNLFGDKDKQEMLSRDEIEVSHKRHAPETIKDTLVGIYEKVIEISKEKK